LAIAVFAALGTAATVWAFHERAPREQFLFLYMPMIGAVAYLGGRAPGFVAWGISIISANYFIIPPAHSFAFGPAIVRIVLLFGTVAAAVVEGAARLRAAETAAHHFAIMVESSEDAIFSSAFDGTIRTWNRGAERLCGYPAVEIIGRSVTILPPPERRREFPELMARVRGGEHVEHFATAWVRKDGIRIDVSVGFSPVPGAGGRIIGVSVIAHDITERTRADRQQRLLLGATEALTSSLDMQARIDALAASVVPALADCCAVQLVADDGALQLAALVHADPTKAQLVRQVQERYGSQAAYAHDSRSVVQIAASKLYPDISEAILNDAITDPALREFAGRLSLGSMITVPITARSHLLGTLWLFSSGSARRYDEQDLTFAEHFAHYAAISLDNARLHQAVATTLQQALLPGAPPLTPGVHIDSVYRPASVGAGVGGDWYDVFQLPGGRLALTVGDVAGHGLEAAVLMGEMRHTIRAAVLEGHDPTRALQVADTVLRAGGGGMATAIVVILDLVKLEFTYATAGHLPPIIVTQESIETIEQPSLPLGFGGDRPMPPEPLSLRSDALLIMYTDGLIEIDHDAVGGEAALRAAVKEEYAGRFGRPAQGILARVIAGRPARDDVAILTVAVDPGTAR